VFFIIVVIESYIASFLQLMMLVDYAGAVFPIITHSPWNGIHLADFVMPFFLFIAGVSLALVYKVMIGFATKKLTFGFSFYILVFSVFNN
jgi:predicted acyltransferase